MATLLKTQPMKPRGGAGGTASVPLFEFLAGGAITLGDLVEFSSGDVIVSNTDTPFATAVGGSAVGLIGVAMHTAANNERVSVALALPGAMFEGDLINEATDIASGVFATHIGINFGTIEDDDGICCINLNDLDLGICLTLGWAKQANTTQDTDHLAGTVAADNPRMIFVFTNSVFFPSHDTDT